jgi:hypothetical protein
MYKTIANSFTDNARDVERLIDFDRDVVELMIMSLDGLKKDVPSQLHSFAGRIERAAQIIRNIRDNESLKPKYGTVCNQAVVLLVSHFSSAIGDLFRKAISVAVDQDTNDVLLNEELKVTFRDMRDNSWNMKNAAADLLIAKKDLTFQDMQSIVRAFSSYVDIQIQKDEQTNNIILGQASRHVIVHAGAMVTEKMIKQVSGAFPRKIKPTLTAGTTIVFTKEEVLQLRDEMLMFIHKLVSKLEAHCDQNAT